MERAGSWRGYLAQASSGPNARLHLADSSDNFFSAVWKYGKQNPAFAKRYFQGAANPAGLRVMRGWGVENVANSMGGAANILEGFQAHHAEWDTKLTGLVSDRFANLDAHLAAGKSFDEALGAAGISQPGQTAESFFSDVFSKAKQAIPKAAAEVAQVEAKVHPVSGRNFAIGTGIAIAAIVAGNLAFSTRESRRPRSPVWPRLACPQEQA